MSLIRKRVNTFTANNAALFDIPLITSKTYALLKAMNTKTPLYDFNLKITKEFISASIDGGYQILWISTNRLDAELANYGIKF